MMFPRVLSLATLLVLGLASAAEPTHFRGDVTFDFDDWSGPSIPVRLFVPDSVDGDTPIVIVMHGASRDVARYYTDWRAEAEKRGLVLAVPHFSREDFPASEHYNLGHVFDVETGEQRPATSWTFAAIEPLFDTIVGMIGGRQTHYTMFGHSAGSQFVHRFLYYVPEARVKRAIAANAGWYMMPDFGVRYPYGLAGAGVQEDVLTGYFARDVVVLLGDADTNLDDENLRSTPEAEQQGQHRYERGQRFYRVASATAAALGADFRWQLQEVPGARHSNAEMTPAAALLVD